MSNSDFNVVVFQKTFGFYIIGRFMTSGEKLNTVQHCLQIIIPRKRVICKDRPYDAVLTHIYPRHPRPGKKFIYMTVFLGRIRHGISFCLPVFLNGPLAFLSAYQDELHACGRIFVIYSLHMGKSPLTIRADGGEEDYAGHAFTQLCAGDLCPVIHGHGEIRDKVAYGKVCSGLLLLDAGGERKHENQKKA